MSIRIERLGKKIVGARGATTTPRTAGQIAVKDRHERDGQQIKETGMLNAAGTVLKQAEHRGRNRYR